MYFFAHVRWNIKFHSSSSFGGFSFSGDAQGKFISIRHDQILVSRQLSVLAREKYVV